MKFTDIFIRRPILSVVISLLILIIGLAAAYKLPIRQYPKMVNTTITITTAYPGASPTVIQSFVTEPIEQLVATADGIDYLTANSAPGMSSITANIKLNYNPETALTNIIEKVNTVRHILPKGTEAPTINKSTGASFPAIILGFTSTFQDTKQISAYITHVIRPKLYSVSGISQIQIWGENPYAMRIWLNPQKMATLNITPQEIMSALQQNNVLATAGQLRSGESIIDLHISSELHEVDQFKNIVIEHTNDGQIRLKDVATVELGSQSYESSVYFNGKPAIFAGINTVPGTNPITVVDNIKKLLPQLIKNFPEGLTVKPVYDQTTYIKSAIKEVVTTILEAIGIVVLIIFLFLGSFRAVLIPVVAIPLSLIGVCSLMLLMGFSLNLLTLLAMVLAIGLVVDDAIVVLENIYRYLEQGATPVKAAIRGSRQIAVPIIVMTLTLAVAYAPIGFIGGLTGALFSEFAFTLAGCVIISGITALTLAPMLCSKLINRDAYETKFARKINHVFQTTRRIYSRMLDAGLNSRPCIVMIAIAALLACYPLYKFTPSELAPQEDQSYIGIFAMGPVTANIDYLEKYNKDLNAIYNKTPGKEGSFIVNGFPFSNQTMSGVMLKPWDQRSLSSTAISKNLQQQLSNISGLQVYAYEPPSLPGVEYGLGVKFIITSTADYPIIYKAVEQIKKQAQKSGLFMYLQSDLKFDKPAIDIIVDRDKAADLGINMQQIVSLLNSLFSGNYVNRFSQHGYSYQVIPQLSKNFRKTIRDVQEINIRAASGSLVPLSSIIKFKESIQPSQLKRFQQLNAVTIEAALIPGVSMARGLHYLQQLADSNLSSDMSYDYAGAARQFMQEGNATNLALALSIIVIFLVLAAQFESFRDPFVILFSVFMSFFSALIPLFLGAGTINIYTKIGLITLVGLISKHGILMIDFANKLQDEEKLSIAEAIKQAAVIRLRPILMTTATMFFGVLPLVLSRGPGSVSRFDMGIVIGSGIALGTCFTLFVIPIMYTYFAKDRNVAREDVSDEFADLDSSHIEGLG